MYKHKPDMIIFKNKEWHKKNFKCSSYYKYKRKDAKKWCIIIQAVSELAKANKAEVNRLQFLQIEMKSKIVN